MKQETETKIVESDWPSEERINAIGQNGGDGIHHEQLAYNKAIDAGVYES